MDASGGVLQLTVLDDLLGVVDDEVRTRMDFKDDGDDWLRSEVGAMAELQRTLHARLSQTLASVMQEERLVPPGLRGGGSCVSARRLPDTAGWRSMLTGVPMFDAIADSSDAGGFALEPHDVGSRSA